MVPTPRTLCLPLTTLIWLSFPLSVLAHSGVHERIEAVTAQIENDPTNAELYLDQRARVRVPMTNNVVGTFTFEEWEDFDARYIRSEVALDFRFFRPEGRAPLRETLGTTPPPDGLFFGGRGTLAASKELADIGGYAGYAENIAVCVTGTRQ